jgi:hypothetical protein
MSQGDSEAIWESHTQLVAYLKVVQEPLHVGLFGKAELHWILLPIGEFTPSRFSINRQLQRQLLPIGHMPALARSIGRSPLVRLQLS